MKNLSNEKDQNFYRSIDFYCTTAALAIDFLEA